MCTTLPPVAQWLETLQTHTARPSQTLPQLELGRTSTEAAHTHRGLRYRIYFIRPTEILQGYTELQSSRQPQVGPHRAPGSKSTTSSFTANPFFSFFSFFYFFLSSYLVLPSSIFLSLMLSCLVCTTLPVVQLRQVWLRNSDNERHPKWLPKLIPQCSRNDPRK